jgi:hypothetical protein
VYCFSNSFIQRLTDEVVRDRPIDCINGKVFDFLACVPDFQKSAEPDSLDCLRMSRPAKMFGRGVKEGRGTWLLKPPVTDDTAVDQTLFLKAPYLTTKAQSQQTCETFLEWLQAELQTLNETKRLGD